MSEAALSLPLNASAQVASRANDPQTWTAICNFVENQSPDTSGQYRYVYQRVFSHAGGVATGDTATAVAGKIRLIWASHISRIGCRSIAYNFRGENIAKLAVKVGLDLFVWDMTRTWQVGLNSIDCTDGRTVLDYVLAEQTSARERRQTSYIAKLEMYERWLRQAGARRAQELAGTACVAQRRAAT